MHPIIITTSTFGKNDPAPLKILNQAGLTSILNPFGRKLTEDEVFELIQVHDPVGILAGVEPLTAKVLEAAKNLKAIARAGIGMDSIDHETARKRGISVTNTPDAPSRAVAELTVGMILSLLRSIHISDAGVKTGKWERPMGRLLHNKTVGIIGCGRVGTMVAKYLGVFECTVIGVDPFCHEHPFMPIRPFEQVVNDADIVSLHLPFNSETHNLFDKKRIFSMKPGSYLINSSRGGLLDEGALYVALKNGHLSGAALDCFENEPYTGPLKDLTNVLLTGHIGSYAREARTTMEIQAAQNLISQLKKMEAL